VNEAGDNAGVIAPPPLIALGNVLLGLLLDWFLPPSILRELFGLWTRLLFGDILIAGGMVLAVFAVRSFVKPGLTSSRGSQP
jgi:hypothetical protein